jgi:hypothetical protein
MRHDRRRFENGAFYGRVHETVYDGCLGKGLKAVTSTMVITRTSWCLQIHKSPLELLHYCIRFTMDLLQEWKFM